MPTLNIKLSRALLGAAIGALALIAPAGAGAAPSIGGFSVRPAESNPANPVTRAYFVQSLARGRYLRDQVAVTNLSARTLHVRVYPVDGVTGVTSGAVYTNRGVRLRKAGRWLKASVSLVSVPAHSERMLPFVVGVPRGAKPGDHLAGIAVENTARQRSRGHFSVTEIVRAVIGVEIEVSGRAGPQLALKGASISALPGTHVPSVVVDLGDDGLKLCKPRLAVGLRRPGSSPMVVHHTLDTILPGDTIPYPLPWPRPLASGTYNATAVATGCGHNVTMHRVLHLAGPLSGTKNRPGLFSAATHPSGGAQWWMLALIALAGVLGGAIAAGTVARKRPHGLPHSS